MTETGGTKRRTQEERSESTRLRLCEATLEALNELGYARTTTQEIARRADVSRGALTHQFASRNDLIIAAFEHLLNSWETSWPFASDKGVPRLEPEDLVDVLWERLFHTSRYVASLEMMLAARIDDELGQGLRKVQKRWTTLRDRLVAEMLGLNPDDPSVALFVQVNLCLLRGLAVHRSFETEPFNHDAVIEEWKHILKSIKADVLKR